MILNILYAVLIAVPSLYYGLGLIKYIWTTDDLNDLSFIKGSLLEFFLVSLGAAILASGAFGVLEVLK